MQASGLQAAGLRMESGVIELKPMSRGNDVRLRGGCFHYRHTAIASCLLMAFALLAVAGCRPHQSADETRLVNGQDELNALNAQVAFTTPLTLEDVVDRVLHNNLDAAVKQHEAEIELESRTGARLKLLPSLILDMERSRRDNYDASVSKTLDTGVTSNDHSISEGKNRAVANVNVAWNLLDFGMSYFRARQATARVEVAEHQLRRTRQNLVLQATETYWNAQVALRAMRRATTLIEEVAERRRIVRKQVEQRMETRRRGLLTDTRLLEAQVRLRRYERDYHTARAQLANLMGVPAGVRFDLVEEPMDAPADPPTLNYPELEQVALSRRPELYKLDLDERIAADEARVALVSMFPNASLFGRASRDQNPFLLESSWYTVGLNASMDLLSLPAKFSRRRLAQREGDLARQKRLALAVGVIAQVHLAGLEFEEGVDEYILLASLAENRRGILEEARREEAEGGTKGEEVIDAEVAAFFAEMRRLEALARIRIARARLMNTVGAEADRPADAPPPTLAAAEVAAEVDVQNISQPLESAPPADWELQPEVSPLEREEIETPRVKPLIAASTPEVASTLPGRIVQAASPEWAVQVEDAPAETVVEPAPRAPVDRMVVQEAPAHQISGRQQTPTRRMPVSGEVLPINSVARETPQWVESRTGRMTSASMVSRDASPAPRQAPPAVVEDMPESEVTPKTMNAVVEALTADAVEDTEESAYKSATVQSSVVREQSFADSIPLPVTEALQRREERVRQRRMEATAAGRLPWSSASSQPKAVEDRLRAQRTPPTMMARKAPESMPALDAEPPADAVVVESPAEAPRGLSLSDLAIVPSEVTAPMTAVVVETAEEAFDAGMPPPAPEVDLLVDAAAEETEPLDSDLPRPAPVVETPAATEPVVTLGAISVSEFGGDEEEAVSPAIFAPDTFGNKERGRQR